jgi:hypothetical protein
MVAPSIDPAQAREIFADARVTFPRWSPRENHIGAWLTFVPPRQSIVTFFLVLTLQEGDPAAIVDVEQGDISWMTTNPWEDAEVGRYLLMQGETKKAWSRMSQAFEQLSETPPGDVPAFDDLRKARVQIMMSVCQDHLGDRQRAERLLDDFRRDYQPDVRACLNQPEDTGEVVLAAHVQRDLQALLAMVQDVLIVEVFLGLESEEAAIAMFQKQLDEATHDEQRLSRAIALSQLLLASRRHAEYARLAREQIVPLMLKLKPEYPQGIVEESGELEELRLVTWVDLPALTLLPLCSRKFLATLPPAELAKQEPWLEATRSQVKDDVELLGIDVMRRALFQQLNRSEPLAEVERSIHGNRSCEAHLGEDLLGSLDAKVDDITKFCW